MRKTDLNFFDNEKAEGRTYAMYLCILGPQSGKWLGLVQQDSRRKEPIGFGKKTKNYENFKQ